MNGAVVIQLGIALFGLSALWMATGRNERARRWACAVGLAGQPFWIAFALRAEGWGLLVLCSAYTLVYLRGLLIALRRR